jgi:hypothetical protein
MQRSAVFSDCRTYRYSLSRIWQPKKKFALFVCLNPSTADEQNDDPTVRRCIGFARRWNFGGLVLVNLFAFRSTDPDRLLKIRNPIGPKNDDYIFNAAKSSGLVILAWGTRGGFLERDQHVLTLVSMAHCLGVTKDGYPKHPLYLPNNVKVQLYSGKSAAA